MMDIIRTFDAKLHAFRNAIITRNCKYFPNLKNIKDLDQSQTSRNSSTNRRAPLTRRTLEASDPVHGDGTIPGTEVTTLTQRLIRKLPLATRERAIVLKSHTQRKHEKLPRHWTDTNFINPNQYGFTKRLSTSHPLLRLTEKIASGFQRGRSTGAVFLDIQKAFDRVWIGGLIYKLIINNFPPAL
ncbi:uncharacterized protein TNCV_3843391 [Trichonephila clavipes]|nr:uncharacterized protein TNCV_3843391 [Trichonephila clavipes]